MSNTDFLRKSEAELLPNGFVQDHVFDLRIGAYRGRAEIDGWDPTTMEAIEICQSETTGDAPKPGQKRKMASDALKLIFLKDLGLIAKGKIYVTSPEMYTWFHQTGSWLSAACRKYGIAIELRHHDKKSTRKKIRNVMHNARKV